MKRKAYGTYDIAEICHVTPSTIGHWIEKGLLPTFTTGGGHRRVWSEDLLGFLKSHNIPVPAELNLSGIQSVLIVDDEEPIRKILRRTLQKLFPDAQIHEAEDGFAAGQKIAQMVPSLVILDLKLPGVDGFKVCRGIRSEKRLKKTKVLAISGHNIEEYRKQALASGADDFLGKPFDSRALKEKLSKLME